MDENDRFFYFVSFAKSNGFGNLEIALTKPIDCIDDLNQIADAIAKQMGQAVAVVSYALLRTEKGTGQ